MHAQGRRVNATLSRQRATNCYVRAQGRRVIATLPRKRDTNCYVHARERDINCYLHAQGRRQRLMSLTCTPPLGYIHIHMKFK